MENIKSVIRKYREEIIKFRRDLHQIPEPAYTEEKTSEYVADRLTHLGLDVRTKIAQFGVVGTKTCSGSGKTLMLRSELDALPICEETGLKFASTHKGAMHACGHDGHMAMVLGAATILSKLEKDLTGQIKFVFQPAEEGPGGAKPMIEQGVMDAPKVDYVLGCHLWPAIPQGVVGVKAGPLMAAMDRFDLIILGQGGHGAMPHMCVDALEVGTQVVNALQRIVSRQRNPLSPAVVTVGQFNGGTSYNIIPGEVHISGTTRTFDPDIWHSWEARLNTIIKGVCSSMGASYTLDYQPGYPVTVNDVWMAEQIKNFARDTVGEDKVIVPEATMGGEDMSYFLNQAKGCFFFLGTGHKKAAPLHNPAFDFNEDILLTGVEIYCRAALNLLGKNQ
ncbi:MAG: amidohydrolase, partial [Spirochaetales bacterium]|nr:amidohydrolase [Spirochaetales bacterium]